MQRTDHIALEFSDNGSRHRDIVLALGNDEWICDSYWLAIDPNLMREREDAQKVRAVLQQLVQQWRDALERLSESVTCYLPYDFSDEYTAWLRCTLSGTDLHVQRGWTPAVTAGEVWPSSVGKLLQVVPDFQAEADEVIISRDAFVASLDLMQKSQPG